ncbi:MAG: hypothetical protein GVY20_14430 [Bacteroidetes bacterium]|jgi:hypothetical protein|nr:hypothetical protein [Bacteroidota bacterium]
MGKRKTKHSSQNAKGRGLKLHHYRFVKFIRYLKDHDAEIKIKIKDNSTGETFPLIYNVAEKGGLTLNSLLVEALNIHPDRAEDYITNKLGPKDTHPDGERFVGLGKVINAIEFYFNSDSPVDEASRLFDGFDPFSIRGITYSVMEEHKKDKEKIKENLKSSFFTEQLASLFYKEFNKAVQLDKDVGGVFQGYNVIDYFPFNTQLHELDQSYRKSGFSIEPDKKILKFERMLYEMIEEYQRMAENLKHPQFMPSYIDFIIPKSRDDMFLYHAKEPTTSHLIENGNFKTFDELIDYRYELIWRLTDEVEDVNNWPLHIQTLLLLTYYEYAAIEMVIKWLVVTSGNDVRFIVYGSDNGTTLKAQQDSLTADRLSRLLSKYHFKNGLADTFEIKDKQILKHYLSLYPEPHAVKHHNTSKDIEDALLTEIHSYLEEMYVKGLNLI